LPFFDHTEGVGERRGVGRGNPYFFLPFCKRKKESTGRKKKENHNGVTLFLRKSATQEAAP
jgi:hypothetical protein